MAKNILTKISNVRGDLPGINYALMVENAALSSGSLVIETGMVSVDIVQATYVSGTIDATTVALKAVVADSTTVLGTKKITITGSGTFTVNVLFGGHLVLPEVNS